ncbi:MAG: hypothetical protein KJ941_03220, partial [Bacteroidetes bacterium]|nr:hypothetical protein [Bacteroidota bacterium]
MKENTFLDLLRQVMDSKSPDMSSCSKEEEEILVRLSTVVEECEKVKRTNLKTQERLEGLLDILVEFSQFNFSMEIPISEEADELDGIALGLQTLGQEIEYY